MKEIKDKSKKLLEPRVRWCRWCGGGFILGASFAFLLIFLVWMDGPGVRWLAPRVAAHFLEKSGIRVGFVVEGRLTSGLRVRDLQMVSDGSLAELRVNRVVPHYRFRELLAGHLAGLEIDGVVVDLRLGLKKEDGEKKPPMELEDWLQAVRGVREKLVPVMMDFKNIRLRATRDGKPELALAESHLMHRAGDSDFDLRLGEITDAQQRVWPEQATSVEWRMDEICVKKLDLMPGMGVRDVVLRMPVEGMPTAGMEMWVDGAVFVVEASDGFSSVKVDLREGELASRAVLERWHLDSPVSGLLTSMSVQIDGLLPDPKMATGAVRVLWQQVESGDWKIPELSMDLEMQAESAALVAAGKFSGTHFSMQAGVPVSRAGGELRMGEISGRLQLEDAAKVVEGLAERFPQLMAAGMSVPASVLDGKFKIATNGYRMTGVDLEIELKPMDSKEASFVKCKGNWQAEGWVAAEMQAEGMKISGNYRLKDRHYEGTADWDGFQSKRIESWLRLFKIDLGGEVATSGKWSGGGDIRAKTHHGEWSLGSFEFQRESKPALVAKGRVTYDWPSEMSTRELSMRTGEQEVSLDAKLADGWLKLANLRWVDGKAEMVAGTAELPMPADFSKWREFLASDERPLAVDIKSKELPLASLKNWVAGLEKLDPRSTGYLQLKVSGNYREPVVEAVVEAKNLRSPEQPKLPAADVRIQISGKNGWMAVEGKAKAADFPAAVMSASLPFRPADWAREPAMISGEKISARLDMPRLDLSRFSSLVPVAQQVGGWVTGHCEVAGVVSQPIFKGRVDMVGGRLDWKEAKRPSVTGVEGGLELALDGIRLKNLKATMAGGSLVGAGEMAILDGKPGAMDFRLRADHLPVLRNDSMILRANADLRLTGTWEKAALTGKVGVVDSLFYRDIELLPIGTPFIAPTAAALPKIDAVRNPAGGMPEPLRGWTVDVRVRTENPFLIRGNFAKGQVDMDLKLGGTLGNPAPDGEVKISDFRAELPFSTLAVRTGTARFRPDTGFDPVLEIRGNAEPRPYRVNIFVYGRASNPQLVLTSSPPLPENEIMTLLATGTTTTGLEDPQAASSRAMQLLAEELRRGRFAVGKRLRPLLGLLDRVDFSVAEADPYTGASFSTATLSITDRWFLSAGMGAEGDSRVMGIWRLTFR